MDRLPSPIAGSISAGLATLLDEWPGAKTRAGAAEMQRRANAAELRENIRRWLLHLRPSAHYEYAGIHFFCWSTRSPSDHPGDSLRIKIGDGDYMRMAEAVERLAQIREEQLNGESERRQREGGVA